jgi:hypothetical protein
MHINHQVISFQGLLSESIQILTFETIKSNSSKEIRQKNDDKTNPR